MAVKLEAIRAAAERVAASHGLEIVGVALTGPAKERTLCVYLEKNAAGRERLRAEIAAAAAAVTVEGGQDEDGAKDGDEAEDLAEVLPERLLKEVREGRLSLGRLEQLSGVTHEDCSAFSRDFGVLLDVEELVPGDEYTLEASSPGLDRKLTKAEDFQRFTGSLAKVQTFEPVRGNRHWQGRLMALASQVSGAKLESGAGAPKSICLDLNAVKQNSKSRKTGVSTVEIALDNIEKAQLVAEI